MQHFLSLKRINNDINRRNFGSIAIMLFSINWYVQPVEKLQVNKNLFGHFPFAFLKGKNTSDFKSALKWNAKTYWKSENWSIDDSCSALNVIHVSRTVGCHRNKIICLRERFQQLYIFTIFDIKYDFLEKKL